MLGSFWRWRYKEPVKFDSQPQVSDAAGAVSLHKDILALQVSVSDGWFAMRPIDFGVKVAQAARCRKCQFQQGLRVQGGKLQVVVQRAVLVVVCDEVHLGGGSCTVYISRYEACWVHSMTNDWTRAI